MVVGFVAEHITIDKSSNTNITQIFIKYNYRDVS